ncbi:helix-turn-helix transcriptional regulator [Bacillus thuringiensis]|nr:helix-turn-helix transcriptional regulator [Bacillus thuringiensis]
MEFECNLRVIFATIKQKDKKFTQKKFAEKVGLSRSALNAIVNEQRPPSFESAYLISQELDMDIRDIWIKK